LVLLIKRQRRYIMAKAGDVIENPVTGERITFLETSEDTNGELLRFEYVLPPGFSIFEHVHPRQEERHEVISGTLWGRVGGREQVFGEGQRVVGPPGVPHSYRNPSVNEELLLVSGIRPPLRFETLFETGYGLARDRKTTRQGIPKNPLQLAVLVDATGDMFYPTGIPMPVLKAFLALFAALAFVGRALGYRARYPKYSGPG
jgi:mannose-6-phosphate isomerase-like protein (cupin superfamily)